MLSMKNFFIQKSVSNVFLSSLIISTELTVLTCKESSVKKNGFFIFGKDREKVFFPKRQVSDLFIGISPLCFPARM